MTDDSVAKLLSELDGHMDALCAGLDVEWITSGGLNAKQAAAFIGLANGYQELRYAIRGCPLRQLAKWAEASKHRDVGMSDRRFSSEATYSYLVEALQNDSEGDAEQCTTGYGATVLEAAADAVSQLKEKGEL